MSEWGTSLGVTVCCDIIVHDISSNFIDLVPGEPEIRCDHLIEVSINSFIFSSITESVLIKSVNEIKSNWVVIDRIRVKFH